MAACPSCDHDVSDAKIRYCGHCGHDLSKRSGQNEADAFDGLIGQTIEGRYRVIERIGVGGMGVVYRVEHVRMGKVAAMKVLRRDLVDDQQAAKRFRTEVEAVSRLDHPNIVQTFDFGEWRGLLFLVMEYIKGEDLAGLIKREGRLTAERVLPLFVQICAALDEAHHQGIIHRDLKPDNILCLQRRGQPESVKVLDFGLAKLREKPGVAEATGAGSLIGTPYYMAPEQVRSEPVDERTDIYSLGATLYRALTGTPPFSAESPMAILTRHLNDAVEPPSVRCPEAGLSPAIDQIVIKAMAKSPGARFPTATAMSAALQAVLEGRTLGDEIPGAAKGGTRTGFQSLAALAAAKRATPASSSSLSDEPGALGPRSAEPAEASVEIPSWVDDPQTGEADDGNSESDAAGRLRREDVDQFEQQMRRKKRVFVAALPLAVALAAVIGFTVVKRSAPRAGPTESEPNDSAASADLLANGASIYGQIGEPSPEGRPDVDYFRVPAGAGQRFVKAALTGIPDLDLLVEVFNSAGDEVGRANTGAKGAGEELARVAIGPLDAYVRVRALWIEGAVSKDANAGSDAPYTLTVTWNKSPP